jgi:hypothetical protein
VSALVELGLVEREHRDRVAFESRRVLASDRVLRLSREYASARAEERAPAVSTQ